MCTVCYVIKMLIELLTTYGYLIWYAHWRNRKWQQDKKAKWISIEAHPCQIQTNFASNDTGFVEEWIPV